MSNQCSNTGFTDVIKKNANIFKLQANNKKEMVNFVTKQDKYKRSWQEWKKTLNTKTKHEGIGK